MQGDLIATSTALSQEYQAYCRDVLLLGEPTWVHPSTAKTTRRLAALCWTDRGMRRAIVHAFRAGGLRYVHPFIGSRAVWELAALIQGATRQPVSVIAPPPRVAAWANDKIAFADVVRRLFGRRLVPTTRSAFNLAVLSHRVRELAHRAQTIGLKIPNAAGGLGNLVVDAARFRGRSLRSTRRVLRRMLSRIGWQGQRALLVDRWETDAISAPSAQLWIPPNPASAPVVEGVFEQVLAGPSSTFVGTRPAELPATVMREIVDRCGLLGLLFKRLGYAGRCSFDMILAGSDRSSARLEFIECNGRWGGTSLPMTLMNRLFGDWATKPFAVHCVYDRGIGDLTFSDLLRFFENDLYDARTRRGRLILFNPARIRARSGIEVVALGESHAEAVSLAHREFPRRLRSLTRPPLDADSDRE